MSAGDAENETWDSDDAWAGARARTREEVRAAFAPRTRVCRNCGHEETTSARACSNCGTPFVEHIDPGMSRRAKRRIAIGIAATVVVLGIAAALIVPAVQNNKHETDARDRAAARATAARERRRLALDQRLHTAVAPGSHAALRALPAPQLAARLRSDLETSITADARARVRAHTLQGPILRTNCTVAPGSSGPPLGKYTCVAVNTEIVRGSGAAAGSLGYPFWAIVDFRRLRYRWCKLNPQAGEGSATPGSVSLAVPVPAGCDIDR